MAVQCRLTSPEPSPLSAFSGFTPDQKGRDMAKPATIKIRLNSTADTGFFYVTKKNPRTMTEKMVQRKYDPVAKNMSSSKKARSSNVLFLLEIFKEPALSGAGFSGLTLPADPPAAAAHPVTWGRGRPTAPPRRPPQFPGYHRKHRPQRRRHEPGPRLPSSLDAPTKIEFTAFTRPRS